MNGHPRFGYQEGITKEAQRLGSRAKLLKQAEDGVPFDERKFGKGQGLRPQLVNFVRSERILIQGVKMLNSPFWVIHPLLSKNITVDGVTIWNEGPNGDGCDPEACENVLIQNCIFHTGDDCIAIKSGRNNDGRLWNQPSKTSSSATVRWKMDMAVWLSEVKSLADARMYMPKIAKWTLLTSTASCASRPTTAAVVSSRTSTCATSLWGNVRKLS